MTISSTQKTANALAIRPGLVILWSAVLKLHLQSQQRDRQGKAFEAAHSEMILPGTAMETVYSRPPVGWNRAHGLKVFAPLSSASSLMRRFCDKN
jgi:hypothetical protein